MRFLGILTFAATFALAACGTHHAAASTASLQANHTFATAAMCRQAKTPAEVCRIATR